MLRPASPRTDLFHAETGIKWYMYVPRTESFRHTKDPKLKIFVKYFVPVTVTQSLESFRPRQELWRSRSFVKFRHWETNITLKPQTNHFKDHLVPDSQQRNRKPHNCIPICAFKLSLLSSNQPKSVSPRYYRFFWISNTQPTVAASLPKISDHRA